MQLNIYDIGFRSLNTVFYCYFIFYSLCLIASCFYSLCRLLLQCPSFSLLIVLCFDSYNLQQPRVSLLFIQKLAVLKDGFQLDSGSQQELWGSSPSLANSELSIPRLYSDAGSQTDIPTEVSPRPIVSFTFSFWREEAALEKATESCSVTNTTKHEF